MALFITYTTGAEETHAYCDKWCALDSPEWANAVQAYESDPQSVRYYSRNTHESIICETCESYAPDTCGDCGESVSDCGGHGDYPSGLAKLLRGRPVNGLPLE